MKYFLSLVILFVLYVLVIVYFLFKFSVSNYVKNGQFDIINNYYVGLNCDEKFKLQLVEIKYEIKVLKENLIGNGFFFEVKQLMVEVKEEIRVQKENKINVCSKNCLIFEVK